MGDEGQRTRRLQDAPRAPRATAHATTLRPEGVVGATLPLIEEATRAAESLPRISVSLGDSDLESIRGKSEIDLHFVGLLGEGGMGRVLLARQRSLQREVAVKTSKPSASAEVSQQLISGRQLTHLRMVQLSMGMNVVVGLWLISARKTLLSNAFNRRLMGTLMFVLVGMLCDRLVGWSLGVEPYAILVHDQLLMSLGVAVAALTLNGRLGWMLVPLLTGLALTAAVPSLVPAVFSATTALAAGMAIWVTRETVREAENTGSSPPAG